MNGLRSIVLSVAVAASLVECFGVASFVKFLDKFEKSGIFEQVIARGLYALG